MIIMALVIAYALIPPTTYGSVSRSTVKREPLPRGTVIETAYFRDDLDWVGSPARLEAGMKNFYAKTGVQPFLYITDNVQGSSNPSSGDVEDFLYELYDWLFEDEAHMLLLFLEKDDGKLYVWYLVGTQANAVIDREAGEIVVNYLSRYYTSDLDTEDYFSKSFDEAAKRIMSVTRSPWIYVGAAAVVLAIIIIIFVWWSKSKKQKNIEAERNERILNTPLEQFGDKNVDDLKGKYD